MLGRMASGESLYAVIGCKASATASEIKKAYHRSVHRPPSRHTASGRSYGHCSRLGSARWLGCSVDQTSLMAVRVGRQALKVHPDKNGDDPGAKERFQSLNHAYGACKSS